MLPAHTARAHPARPWGRGGGLAGTKNSISTWGPPQEPVCRTAQGHGSSAMPPPCSAAKGFGLLMARGGGRKNNQQTIAKVKSEQERGCERGGVPDPVIFLGDSNNNGRNICSCLAEPKPTRGWGLGTSRNQPGASAGPKGSWGRTLHSSSADVSDILCAVTCAEDGAKHSTQLPAW